MVGIRALLLLLPLLLFFFRRKAASFRLFMCDVIVLAGSASSSGVHLLQHFILSARVPSGNCWKHLPHFCDVLYSSTKTMSQFLFFFTEIANFRVPGQRWCFFIGELGLIFAAPIKTNADLLLTILFVSWSIAFWAAIYLSNANRVYFRRVYVVIPSWKNFSRWSTYSRQTEPDQLFSIL